MEKVFWLMWLSDIAGSIGAVGIVAAITLCGAAIVLGFLAAMTEEREFFTKGMRFAKWLVIPIVVAIITPNPKTIQMLAVVSASEAMAGTQLGAKGLQAVDAILDRVIGESKAKK